MEKNQSLSELIRRACDIIQDDSEHSYILLGGPMAELARNAWLKRVRNCINKEQYDIVKQKRIIVR